VVPEQVIDSLDISKTEELRAFGGRANGNGKHSDVPNNLPASRAAKATRGTNRQVDPDPSGWSVLSSGDRRPWGRDTQTLSVIRTIRDLDAQAAHAVWNFLRLVNPGHHLRAISLAAPADSNENEYIDPAGQAILDDLAKRVGAEYGGGLDQLHNVLALSVITNGAVAIDAAPTDDLSDTEDWYPVDPRLITFKRDKSSKRLVMGQKINGQFKELNPEQVFYQPLDPDIDDPYGRPPLLPAIHASMAKAQMLNDLRAVAHNQGYPRLDVTLQWEEIKKAAPPNMLANGSEQEFRAWAAAQLDMIASDYEGLNVDDTFVHFDWITVSMVGPNYAASSFDFAGFEKILSRSLQSSLKTLPILLGINDNTSETHGSIQWQIQVAAILQLQRLCKRVIEKAGNASLRYGGVNARAKMEYDEIRAIDRRFEAQSQQLEAKNAAFEVQMGWRTNDEAAKLTVGHEAVDVPIWDTKTGTTGTADDLAKLAAASVAGGPDGGASKESKTGDQKTEPKEKAARLWSEEDTSRMADNLLARLLSERKVNARAADIQDDPAVLERYQIAARVYFAQAMDEVIEELEAEGYELRDTARDIAESAFGLGFARKMKGLLREAVAEGVQAGQLDAPAPERLVDRIWETNRQYIAKIKDELRDAIRANEFKTLADVRAWFDSRAWREEQMGRFLAKQGLAGGFAYARSTINGLTRFAWHLGAVESRHCESCLARDGNEYSYEALLSQGFPGSDALACGARCHCTVEEIGRGE
jgi:hypothetical protein